jgi:glycosyltransferase involved in cell wall biosynthesis
LVRELRDIGYTQEQVIVVDSSDEDLSGVRFLSNYIKSNHKNQPYQRYLGWKLSKSDYLLFLDDDMEILNRDFGLKLENIIADQSDLAGIGLNFIDKNNYNSLAGLPQSKLRVRQNVFGIVINRLKLTPTLNRGQVGMCGNRGKQPDYLSTTQWVSGGAFVASRKYLFQNFNFQIFDLFESKTGMGEDFIIGYGLSKCGVLLYLPDVFFCHNDINESNYSKNVFNLFERTVYSRLHLACEYQRLNGNLILFAYFYFHIYAFLRVVGCAMNFILSPTLTRKEIFFGSFKGWMRTFFYRFKYYDIVGSVWMNAINNDISERNN